MNISSPSTVSARFVIVIGSSLVFGVGLGAPLLAQSPTMHFQVDAANFLNVVLLGYSVSGAGDVDGDGYGDVIIGAPHAGNIGLGRAFVHSGRTGACLYQLLGTPATVISDYFGWSVSGAGDVDADGFDDVIVGAPISRKATVFSGRTGGVLHSWTGPFAGDQFGWSVTGLGDVDGDGYADVVVGAPGQVCPPTWCPPMVAGRVYVYSGRTGALLRTHVGSWVGDRFGDEVSRTGDLDGDGIDDLLVQTFRLSLKVYSGATGSVVYDLPIPLISSSDGCGDIDGDGLADFVVGVGGPCPGTPPPYVSVHSGATGAVLYQVPNPQGTFGFGHVVAGTGDFDGDSVGDFLVGAPGGQYSVGCGLGKVRMYSGRSGTLVHELVGSAFNTVFGYSVAGAGDVNGDGFADLVVGEFYGGTVGGLATVFTSQPLLPATCAQGNVNSNGPGGTVDVLGVRHSLSGAPSFGLPGRTVVVPTTAATLELWMALPPAHAGPAGHLVFGVAGDGLSGPAYPLPGGLGDACFPPQILSPTTPGLFLLGDTLGLFGFPLAPANTHGSGNPVLIAARPPFTLTLTLQAVIEDPTATSGFSVTNALRVLLP